MIKQNTNICALRALCSIVEAMIKGSAYEPELFPGEQSGHDVDAAYAEQFAAGYDVNVSVCSSGTSGVFRVSTKVAGPYDEYYQIGFLRPFADIADERFSIAYFYGAELSDHVTVYANGIVSPAVASQDKLTRKKMSLLCRYVARAITAGAFTAMPPQAAQKLLMTAEVLQD